MQEKGQPDGKTLTDILHASNCDRIKYIISYKNPDNPCKQTLNYYYCNELKEIFINK